MFEDIAWSTEHVAEQTRARAREIGLDVHLLPVWYDVDDIETLRRLHAELGSNEPVRGPVDAPGPRRHRARHTAALLNRLWPDGDFSRSAEDFMRIEKAAV
jgi:hypothetical protein